MIDSPVDLDTLVIGASKLLQETGPINGLTHIRGQTFPISTEWFPSSLRPWSPRRRMGSKLTFRCFGSAGAADWTIFQLVCSDRRGQALLNRRRPEPTGWRTAVRDRKLVFFMELISA